MPYYMGDYYRGDPFLGFGAMANIVRKGIGVVRNLAIGGGGAKSAIRALPAPVTGALSKIGGGIRRIGPIAPIAGGAIAGAALGKLSGGEAGIPKGFHISKSKHSLGKLVRNRHMRVTNPRALRRAIRRAHGFAKLARKVMHFTSPRPPRGRAYFRPKRRSAKKL